MFNPTAYASEIIGDAVCIHTSTGVKRTSVNVDDLLKFLRYSASQTIRVMWNLDDTIAPILRKLPSEILERLSRFDENLEYKGHELYYLPERMFRVGKSRFYGIRDFWGAHTNYVPTITETYKLACELLTTLDKIGLPNPRKLTSPIAVFEDSEWGRSVYATLPKGYQLPENCHEILEYASKADGKDWVSNHYVGHFNEGEIFDYDISSCYPSIACHLPDIKDLELWKATILGDKELNATMGVVRGKFTLNTESPNSHCSPIICAIGDLQGNPLGQLPEGYYMLAEVNFILNNNLGTFKLRDGWFANPRTDKRPFKEIMEALYNKRAISPLASSITKSIANSLIGKLIETKVSGEYGQLRNDLYHAQITAGARIMVAEFLLNHHVQYNELVCVQTDGVKLTRNIQLEKNGMGSWVNKGSNPTLLLSPFKVYSADAKPYRLTYTDVMNMINEHPLSQRYIKTIKHTLTLVQAIRQHNDPTKVGEIIDMPDSIDLIALELEQNRKYPRLPKTGRALLDNKYSSKPLIL